MANRRLTKDEINRLFKPLIDDIRNRLNELSGNDKELIWALRRKLVKELGYDEKGHPMLRKKLKVLKFKEQNGLCAICGKELPEKYSELDRFEAMNGYTPENTRLVHKDCHIKVHESKNYT